MSDGRPRRNRVDERLAVAIGALSGVVAVASGASPTGSTIPDAVVVFVSIGFVTWASASAPWWAGALACGVGASVALDPIVAAVGVVGFLLGLRVGVRRRDQAVMRAVVGAIALNVLVRSELAVFLGLSAVVGVTVGGALLVLGLRRRPSGLRRVGYGVIVGAAGVAAVAVLGAGLAGASSRSDVSTGASLAREAVGSLNDGDYGRAADLFERSSEAFVRGASDLGAVFATPGRVVPVVAQNLTAARDLAEVAADATRDAGAALRQVDPSQLTLRAGVVDLSAVEAVEAPLLRVEQALESLDDAADRVSSPWLVAPLQRELDDLEAEIDERAPQLEDAIDAVRRAPAFLGADGTRRYLVLFTSPAEARGTGGFFGNWAELVAADGRIRLSAFGRTGELNAELRAGSATCDPCPEEFVDFYGQYGFTTGEGGSVAGEAWSNITMPAHFPHAAGAIAALYPQSGGRTIDGVVVMDPWVLAQLMEYTGPVEVPELDVVVAPSAAVEFLLVDQYVLAEEKELRVEALETLGVEAIGRLLATSLPDPGDLARDLGPLVEERRLLFWTADPDEREFLSRVGLLGDLPALDEVDGGFSVAVNNASANKIDSFLERTVEVGELTGDDGRRQLVAEVSLTNTAPSTGLPDYVLGNGVGLPRGSSRLIVHFYGPATLAEISRDGDPTQVGPFSEGGWTGYRTTLDLAPGETTTYRLVFGLDARPADADFEPSLWEQPLRR